MKIHIPNLIKREIDLIESISIEFSESLVQTSPVSLDHIKRFPKISFVELNTEVYKSAEKIFFKLLYKDGTKKFIKYPNKADILYKPIVSGEAGHAVKHQTSSLFDDTAEGRRECFEALENLMREVSTIRDNEVGTKNLIYYTVYFNSGYVELLAKSIQTIITNCPKRNFDILLITDKPTQALLKQNATINSVSPKYHLTPTPKDGVEASKNKTIIFNYKYIDKYKTILFLDCDVMSVKDIAPLFAETLNSGLLYTAGQPTLGFGSHKTFFHGFECLDNEHVEEMELANQRPFNAGQFLFKNSDGTKAHFKNLQWFMKNWAGDYFF